MSYFVISRLQVASFVQRLNFGTDGSAERHGYDDISNKGMVSWTLLVKEAPNKSQYSTNLLDQILYAQY